MRKEKILELLWDEFEHWMRGQTVAIIDGELDYYTHDVEAYLTKIRTGYDRQEDPIAWD